MNFYLIENDWINIACIIIFTLSIATMAVLYVVDFFIVRLPDGAWFRLKRKGVLEDIKQMKADIEKLKKE